MADKKKADYQEGLEKSCADSAAQSHDSYMKDPEKVVHKAVKVTWRFRKRVMLTVQHKAAKVNKNDLEKSHNDSAAWSRESCLKDPEKRHVRNCVSYMEDPEKSCADSAVWNCESYNVGVWSKS